MPNIAIFIEQRAGDVKKVAWQMISEGRKLVDEHGGRVVAVVLDTAARDVVATAGRHGAHEVYVGADPAFERYDSELWTTALASFMAQAKPDALLLGATAMGKDLAPKLAARLRVACISDAVGLAWQGGLSVRRPMFAGKCLADVTPRSAQAIVSIRPNAFALHEAAGTAESVAFDPMIAGVQPKARVAAIEAGSGAKVTLTEAEVVVSGGRGIKGPENYALIEALADAFGAAAGASRAIVDAGWVEYPRQVGQTGKTVAPNLYVACGISGAIQHLAGMSSSKCIVAINKDPAAPIFKVADYGVAGDLFQVLPALTDAVKAIRG